MNSVRVFPEGKDICIYVERFNTTFLGRPDSSIHVTFIVRKNVTTLTLLQTLRYFSDTSSIMSMDLRAGMPVSRMACHTKTNQISKTFIERLSPAIVNEVSRLQTGHKSWTNGLPSIHVNVVFEETYDQSWMRTMFCCTVAGMLSKHKNEIKQYFADAVSLVLPMENNKFRIVQSSVYITRDEFIPEFWKSSEGLHLHTAVKTRSVNSLSLND